MRLIHFVMGLRVVWVIENSVEGKLSLINRDDKSEMDSVNETVVLESSLETLLS